MKSYGRLLFSASALIGANAFAGEFFSIALNTDGVTNATVKSLLIEKFALVEDEINSKFPDVNTSAFTQNTANAMALAGGGVGVDYATPFDVASVGANIGLAADIGDKSFSDFISSMSGGSQAFLQNLPGFGVQGSMTVGLNFKKILGGKKLGPIELDRFKGWIGFFSMNRNISSVSAKVSQWSVHSQYRIVQEKKYAKGMFKWNGLDVGAGLRSGSFDFNFSQDISGITLPIEFGAPVGTVNAVTTGSLAVSGTAKSTTIPLEVSSGLRLLYVLGLYGGLGTDFNFGKATLSGSDANGGVGLQNAPTGTGTGIETVSADLNFNIAEDKKPGAVKMRYFGGVVLDLSAFNIYLQASKYAGMSAIGANVGARAYW